MKALVAADQGPAMIAQVHSVLLQAWLAVLGERVKAAVIRKWLVAV